MLTTADLATARDFTIGRLTVSPSRRLVENGERSVSLEPRVMQALMLLAHFRGTVVTRQSLFDELWGGTMVGDDSLNRAVAGVRKALDLDPDLKLETVPRTGYRLSDPAASEASAGSSARRLSRRWLIVGGAATAGIAGLGAALLLSPRRNDGFDALVERGEQALSYGDPAEDAVPHLERAVTMRPDDARARGLLAYALAQRTGIELRAGNSSPASGGAVLPAADRAARDALALDPNQPDARVALTMLNRHRLDFAATEDALRAILASAPDNIRAMQEYWRFLVCVGRTREALAWVERALAVAPHAAANHYPRAQLLWINGRDAEADRIIDRAHRLWPAQRGVRFARFMLFAFTGRERAAMALLDSPDTAPQVYSADEIALWRVSLAALERRTPAAIAAALDANLEAARANPGSTSQAVMVLSALGKLDAAFDLADALFQVPRSTKAAETSPADKRRADSVAWRFAPWLFTPPIAPMRSDPRFGAICQTIGLTDYWARRGIKPDVPIGAA